MLVCLLLHPNTPGWRASWQWRHLVICGCLSEFQTCSPTKKKHDCLCIFFSWAELALAGPTLRRRTSSKKNLTKKIMSQQTNTGQGWKHQRGDVSEQLPSMSWCFEEPLLRTGENCYNKNRNQLSAGYSWDTGYYWHRSITMNIKFCPINKLR